MAIPNVYSVKYYSKGIINNRHMNMCTEPHISTMNQKEKCIMRTKRKYFSVFTIIGLLLLFLGGTRTYTDTVKSQIRNAIKMVDESTIKTVDGFTTVHSEKMDNLNNYRSVLEDLKNINDRYGSSLGLFLYKDLFSEAVEKYAEKNKDYLEKNKGYYIAPVSPIVTTLEDKKESLVQEGVVQKPEYEIWEYCRNRWEYYDKLEGKYSGDKHTEDVFNDASKEFGISSSEAKEIWEKIDLEQMGIKP